MEYRRILNGNQYKEDENKIANLLFGREDNFTFTFRRSQCEILCGHSCAGNNRRKFNIPKK